MLEVSHMNLSGNKHQRLEPLKFQARDSAIEVYSCPTPLRLGHREPQARRKNRESQQGVAHQASP